MGCNQGELHPSQLVPQFELILVPCLIVHCEPVMPPALARIRGAYSGAGVGLGPPGLAAAHSSGLLGRLASKSHPKAPGPKSVAQGLALRFQNLRLYLWKAKILFEGFNKSSIPTSRYPL